MNDICPNCKSKLKYAEGIGSFCDNPDCDIIDNLSGEDNIVFDGSATTTYVDNADYLISGEQLDGIIKSVEKMVSSDNFQDMWVMAMMLLNRIKKVKGGCDE